MPPKKILIIANAKASVYSHPLLEKPPLKYMAKIVNEVYYELIFHLRIVQTIRRRKNNIQTIYAVGEFIQQKLRSKNIISKPLEIHIDMGLGSQEISKEVDDLFFSWRRIEENEKYRELLRYNGVSILDTGSLFIYNSLRRITFLINYLSELLEKEQPDEIIVTENDIIGKTAFIIGQSKGIPTKILGSGSNAPVQKLKTSASFFFSEIIYMLGFRYKISSSSTETYRNQKTPKNKILILVSCPSDVNTITPVIKSMGDEDGHELIILSINKSTEKLLQEKYLPFKTFDDYMNRELSKKIKDERRALKSNWNFIKYDEGFRDNLQYKEIPLWRLIKDKIEFLFSKDLNIEKIKHILDVEKPDLLVTLSMGEISSLRVANTLARMRDIPTLFVLHSTYVIPNKILSTINVDKIAVCGDDSKKNFIEVDVPSQRIEVTGQPRFDVYFKMDEVDNDKIKRKLGIDPKKRIFLLIPQTNGPYPVEESEALLKGVFNAMREFPKHHLVVKLHPAESDKLAMEVASKMKIKDVTIIKDADLVALLKSCDTLLTVFSNVGVEAMLLDKPVVIIDLTKAVASNSAEYTRGKAVVSVFSSDEIVPAIKSVLEDPKVKEDLRTHRKIVAYNMAYKPDGKASERVAELMISMVKGKKEKEIS